MRVGILSAKLVLTLLYLKNSPQKKHRRKIIIKSNKTYTPNFGGRGLCDSRKLREEGQQLFLLINLASEKG